MEHKENHVEEHVEMVPKIISNEPMENWVESLWEELRKAKENREDKGKAPMVEIDVAKKQTNIDLIMGFKHKMTNSLNTSKA